MKLYTESDFAGIAPLEIDDAERNVAYFLAPVSVTPFHDDEITFAVAVQGRPLTRETDGAGNRNVTGVDWNAETSEYIAFDWLDAGCQFPQTPEDVEAMLDGGAVASDYGEVAFLNPDAAERIGMRVEAFTNE